jgi:hypothetical protein
MTSWGTKAKTITEAISEEIKLGMEESHMRS